MHKTRRVVNRAFAATSEVRLIEDIKPREPEEAPVVILKPKARKKHLPGVRLIMKLAHEKEREKAREASKPPINMDAVEAAINGILDDLEL